MNVDDLTLNYFFYLFFTYLLHIRISFELTFLSATFSQLLYIPSISIF